jgi:hypothetical protein
MLARPAIKQDGQVGPDAGGHAAEQDLAEVRQVCHARPFAAD